MVGEATTAECVISDVISCKLAFLTQLIIDIFYYCTTECVDDVQGRILKTKTIFKHCGHQKKKKNISTTLSILPKTQDSYKLVSFEAGRMPDFLQWIKTCSDKLLELYHGHKFYFIR